VDKALGAESSLVICVIPKSQLTNWHDSISKPLENFNIGKKAYHDEAICCEPQARSTRTGLRSGVNGVRAPQLRLNTAIDLLHCLLWIHALHPDGY
jgi:hypothetical protein